MKSGWPRQAIQPCLIYHLGMRKDTIQPSLTTNNPTDLELNRFYKWSWERTTTSNTESNKNWKAIGLTSDSTAE